MWGRRCLVGAVAVVAVGCARTKPVVVTAPPSIQVERRNREGAPRAAVRWTDDFWRAVGSLDFVNAWTVAESADQRRLVDALQLMTGAEGDGADTALAPLLVAPDTLVRNAARLAYGALLSSRSEWRRLADFARSSGGGDGDAAGVQAWAPAFADATTEVRFTDSVVVLPLVRSPTGVPMIAVRINGVTRQLWLDTGSSITILSSAFAVECGVAPQGADTLELLTAVGRITARPTIIDSIRIGGAVVAETPGMIVDAGALMLRSGNVTTGVPLSATDYRVDGVIGFDIIRALDVTIDDELARVTIRRPVRRVADRDHPRNLLWFGIPIVTLLGENGTTVHLSLDTGAEETYGTRTLATKTRARAVVAERRNVHGFGGSAAERGVLVPRLRLYLGDVPLVFERVFLYSAQYPTLFQLDGTLGADVGRGNVVRIDMTNGRFDVGAGRR